MRVGARAGTVILILALALLCGCSPGQDVVQLDASPPDGSAAGNTEARCAAAVGPQLRERATVDAQGLMTLLPGPLPCPGVGIWIARFALDADPALDPAPRFGARYTGQQPVTVRLPGPAGRCSAAAVFFTLTGTTADAGPADAAAERATVRSELTGWPAGSTGVVPAGSILKGKPSPVLAATVVGDPAGCSPGESVSTPVAAVGDCWAALPPADEPATPAAVARGATRFRRTTCGAPHTHEVYWTEHLTTRAYLAEGRAGGQTAAGWARQRADQVCRRRSTDLELTHDVSRKDVFLEFLWPATLTYPPPSDQGWTKAQVVCLARWQDALASTRHILHR